MVRSFKTAGWAFQLQEWYGEEKAETGSCLYWSQVTMKVLQQAGLRPVLQAGSVQAD